MKAEELRIGNWLNYDTGQSIEPCKIDSTDIDNIAKDYMFSADLHSPIPLTPDILEKAGFEKLPHVYNCERFHIVKEDDGDYWWTFFSKNGAYINKILYLHQLQNLFFALCGTELNINLQTSNNG